MPVSKFYKTVIKKRVRRGRKRFNPSRARLMLAAGVKRRIPRALLPKKYIFKRSIVETIPLNTGTSTPPSGWSIVDNGYCKFDIHTLAELHDYTDFTNLFSQYKINGVQTKFYMSCTGAESGSSLGNAQIQLIRSPYQTGAGSITDYTEQKFLDMQARRITTLIRANGYPVSFYTKCNQLSEIYESGISSSYGVTRPKFVSTTETATQHYSNIFRLQLVNGADLNTWTAGGVILSLKIIRTFYITMKKVD